MYEVLIDELVIKQDFKSIDNADRQKILKAIREKLSIEPEKYGEPLRGDLAGLCKLKVGKYRVVYEIQKEKVLVYVIKVGFRRDYEVYKQLTKRVGEIKK